MHYLLLQYLLFLYFTSTPASTDYVLFLEMPRTAKFTILPKKTPNQRTKHAQKPPSNLQPHTEGRKHIVTTAASLTDPFLCLFRGGKKPNYPTTLWNVHKINSKISITFLRSLFLYRSSVAEDCGSWIGVFFVCFLKHRWSGTQAKVKIKFSQFVNFK